MLSRSIATVSVCGAIGGQSTWPRLFKPMLNCGPTSRVSTARISPRISDPSASSMLSVRARRRLVWPAGPISISPNVTEGVGSTPTLIGPATRTLSPTMRLASASKKARCSFQLTKYGPTSAVSSARINAIANPNSVVCTLAPVSAFRLRRTWGGPAKENLKLDAKPGVARRSRTAASNVVRWRRIYVRPGSV